MSLTRSFDNDTWTLSENGQEILSVRETMEDGKIVVCLSGSLRSDTVHAFKDELVALMTVGKDVIVDCEGLQYISNACKNALLFTQQKADSIKRGTLTLRRVPAEIYKEFQETNLHELLMIE